MKDKLLHDMIDKIGNGILKVEREIRLNRPDNIGAIPLLITMRYILTEILKDLNVCETSPKSDETSTLLKKPNTDSTLH